MGCCDTTTADVLDRVETITFDRSEARNALTGELGEAISDQLYVWRRDDRVDVDRLRWPDMDTLSAVEDDGESDRRVTSSREVTRRMVTGLERMWVCA